MSATAVASQIEEASEPKTEATPSLFKLSPTAIDLIAGSCAGMCATFVSHPLDTVKIRYQTSASNSITLRSAVSDIYLHEGVSIVLPSHPLSAGPWLLQGRPQSYGWSLSHQRHVSSRLAARRSLSFSPLSPEHYHSSPASV